MNAFPVLLGALLFLPGCQSGAEDPGIPGTAISAIELSSPGLLRSQTFGSLPSALQNHLVQARQAGGWSADCESMSKLSLRVANLGTAQALGFLEVPDYLCTGSNSFVPVLVDEGNIVGWGAAMQGQVGHLLPLPDGGFYLAAYSAIEGSYPILSASTDGLVWREVGLPSERTRDCCIERISSLIWRADGVEVAFSNDDATLDQCWRLDPLGPAGGWTLQPQCP